MKSSFSNFVKNRSVRSLIVLIFTVEIVFFAMLTGWLSYTSSLNTIAASANQISSNVSEDITQMVTMYLEEPYKIEQIHKNAIVNNQLDFSNQAQLDKHFVETLRIFPRVTNTYIALVDGREYGARKEDDDSFSVWNSNIEDKTLDYYKYDSQFGRQDYVKSILSYDTRQRPPFLKGIELKKPGWTDIYVSATGRGLVVTSVYPVYAPNNELIGVLGSSLLLNWIDEYLKSLTVTENSSIFIIGKDEKLIAGTKVTRSGKSNNLLLSQSILALKATEQAIDNLNESVDASFQFNGEKILMHARPIHGKNGLEWINIILIPEKDLTHSMNGFMSQLLLITVAACILGLVTGVLSARYIINPIIKVNQMAKKIAESDFTAKLEICRQDEIGQLVNTVNEMSAKLEQSFNNLRERGLRIRLLTAGVETSTNLVIILDKNQLIWWANSSFEKLSGFTLKEIIGKNAQMLISGQNAPELILQAKTALLNNREWRGEVIAHRKSGQDYVEEVCVTPILDDTGETTYYLVVGQDITEKVKVREAVAAAQEAKAKAEKIFSIGTMAAGISHEINQPLNSIKVISGGILYLVKQGEKIDAEEFIESIREISSQTDRITNIIKHLRSFICRDQTQLVPCDLNSSVEMALDLVGKQLAAHRVNVQKNLDKDIPPVLAVSTGLEEVVVNLLVNAMQALDTADNQNKEITIRTCFKTKVTLEISDNGPGIDPKIGDTMFEPFTSSKLQGENLGLGLAIVNNIIASYSGTIVVTSNHASGVTFIIELPAV